MTKSKFPKSVSFNLKNKTDQAILEYVKKRNFSGYVKKLIVADMRNNNVEITSTAEESLSKFEQLKRQLESAKNVNNNANSDSDSKTDN